MACTGSNVKMWKKEQILTQLNTNIDMSIDRHQYNICRYYNNLSIDLRSIAEYNFLNNTQFDFSNEIDLQRSAAVNIIKSVIDTIVSKLSNQRVRPYFNPVNGTYKTNQIVRNIQTYFDQVYDFQGVHKKISAAFRQAAIFGCGYLFVNPFTNKIEQPPTWTVSVLDSEYAFTKPTKMMIKYTYFPTLSINKLTPKKIEVDNNYCTAQIYIDTEEKIAELYLNGRVVDSKKYIAEELPLVYLHYNPTMTGNKTTTLVEELDGIQTQIDIINAKISTAMQLNPANTTYVLEGSNLKSSDVNNRVGNVYQLRMPAGMSQLPVHNVTPPPIDPAWLNLLDYYINKAYDIVGVSQLSAMSKKPCGLDSGVALQTMEDIESDRFECQVQNYINSYVDLAKVLIDVLPEDEQILPDSYNTIGLTWKDVKKQNTLFKIQYSAATALSKDPSEKLKQIMQMTQVGLIPASKAGEYMDLPDLQDAYKFAAAVNSGVQKVITNAIEEDTYEIPEYISYQVLSQEIATIQNQLYASLGGKNDKETYEALERINNLDVELVAIMTENGVMDVTGQNEIQTTEEGIAGQQIQAASSADELMQQGTPDALMEQGNPESLANDMKVDDPLVDNV